MLHGMQSGAGTQAPENAPAPRKASSAARGRLRTEMRERRQACRGLTRLSSDRGGPRAFQKEEESRRPPCRTRAFVGAHVKKLKDPAKAAAVILKRSRRGFVYVGAVEGVRDIARLSRTFFVSCNSCRDTARGVHTSSSIHDARLPGRIGQTHARILARETGVSTVAPPLLPLRFGLPRRMRHAHAAAADVADSLVKQAARRLDRGGSGRSEAIENAPAPPLLGGR